MKFSIAKGFSEAQSDWHKRKQDEKEWSRISGYVVYDCIYETPMAMES